jgi:hypothetical protein
LCFKRLRTSEEEEHWNVDDADWGSIAKCRLMSVTIDPKHAGLVPGTDDWLAELLLAERYWLPTRLPKKLIAITVLDA